jgi:hypothetical protein
VLRIRQQFKSPWSTPQDIETKQHLADYVAYSESRESIVEPAEYIARNDYDGPSNPTGYMSPADYHGPGDPAVYISPAAGDHPAGVPIAPEQQTMNLSDITSAVLHSDNMTQICSRGKAYLSDAVSFPENPWPATAQFYGLNRRLMINLACQLVSRQEQQPIRNVYFLIHTASSYLYLSPEAMGALLPEGANIPKVLAHVWAHSKNQGDDRCFQMYISPQGTPEEPGKFKDVNVLGMDFISRFSMTVDGSLDRFKLLKPD